MIVMLDDGPRRTSATPCRTDPDRWAVGGDDPELKALCRGCPRRWLCAKEAVETPGAEGMWSGVHLPAEGRGRTFALRQLRSLASHGGYLVRDAKSATR
jgi:WhiB family transcriptional regulator, redox-sensing transcriptional regulator